MNNNKKGSTQGIRGAVNFGGIFKMGWWPNINFLGTYLSV